MKIVIKEIKPERTPFGYYFTIRYEARHGDFFFSHSLVWKFTQDPSEEEVNLILELITKDVASAYERWRISQEYEKEILDQFPRVKALKGTKIPESYWLAMKLERKARRDQDS